MSASEDGEGNINDILREIGVPGHYQLHVFFWTFVVGITNAWQTVAIPFTQGDLGFRCAEDTVTYNGTELYSMDSDAFNNTCHLSPNSSTECQQFEYDTSLFDSTIVSEFDLVCSRVVYSTISNMLYTAVSIPGGLFSGWLSDRFGRRKNAIGGLLAIGIIGLVTAFSVNIEMYIALRCLMSIPTVTVYDSTNTMLSEITAPAKRPHILIFSVMSWSIGICILSPLAYWLTNWVHLQVAISAPCILLAVILWWAFDESPHWLYSKGRFREAQLVIDKIARWNKCTDKNIALSIDITDNRADNSKGQTEKKEDNSEDTNMDKMAERESADKAHGCLQILRNPSFVAVFFVCAFGWFACNLGYYGLLLGIGDLVGDIYINNFVGGIVELVAYAMSFLILKGGRKKIYVSFLLIGGLGLISSAIVSLYLPAVIWLIITLTMIGRLCISSAWQVLYVWCLELFPTSVRVTMLQAALTFGHIGGTVGVLMVDLPQLVTSSTLRVDIIVPITYGTLMAVSGLTAIYLPETSNKPLPVTIEDAIKATKKRRDVYTNNEENAQQTKL